MPILLKCSTCSIRQTVLPLVGGLAHPEFGSSVNPITIRGADYAHHITASPPGFENPAASLPKILLDFFKHTNTSIKLQQFVITLL